MTETGHDAAATSANLYGLASSHAAFHAAAVNTADPPRQEREPRNHR